MGVALGLPRRRGQAVAGDGEGPPGAGGGAVRTVGVGVAAGIGSASARTRSGRRRRPGDRSGRRRSRATPWRGRRPAPRSGRSGATSASRRPRRSPRPARSGPAGRHDSRGCGAASCRSHHSATRSPVPSADDPARRRRLVAPLDRPDGRRPDGLGTARASLRTGRLRRRIAGPAGDRAARADPRRQVDRARRDGAPRWRATDVEGACRAPRIVLAAVADDPLYRVLGRVGRPAGRGHRPHRARRSPTQPGRPLAPHASLARRRPRLVGRDRRDRGVRGRAVQRVRRARPGGRPRRLSGPGRRPPMGQPAAADRRTQGDRPDRIAPARHGRADHRRRPSSSRSPTGTPRVPAGSRRNRSAEPRHRDATTDAAQRGRGDGRRAVAARRRRTRIR